MVNLYLYGVCNVSVSSSLVINRIGTVKLCREIISIGPFLFVNFQKNSLSANMLICSVVLFDLHSTDVGMICSDVMFIFLRTGLNGVCNFHWSMLFLVEMKLLLQP